MKEIRWAVETAGNRSEFVLPAPCRLFTIGRDKADIPVYSNEYVKVRCVVGDDEITVTGDGGTQVSFGGETLNAVKVSETADLEIMSAEGRPCFKLEIRMETVPQPIPDRRIELMPGSHAFGSREDCAVNVPTIVPDRNAFSLIRNEDDVLIYPGDIPLGVYVNDKRLVTDQPVRLKKNDFIFVAGSMFVYNGKDELLTTSDIEVTGLNYRDRTDSISHLEYPHMIRTSRYHYEKPTEQIDVLDPPKLQEKQKQNLIVTLLPVAVMLLLVVLLRNNGGGSMLISVGMMSVGAITSIYTLFYDKKDFAKKKQKRFQEYSEYLKEREKYIQECREDEREILNNIYITPEQELQNVMEFSPDLFDRTETDADFLHIRMGYGRLLSGRQVKRPEHKELEEKDEMRVETERLEKKYRYNTQMPATVEATKANAIGILGDIESLRKMMNVVTLDLVTRHLPADVELYLLCDKDFEEQLQVYRMLPHVSNKASQRRNIAFDQDSKNQMLEELYKRLADREASGGSESWIVIYVHSDSEVMQHPLMKFVSSAASFHAVFIFWSEQREELPIGCSTLVRLFTNERSGVIVDMFDKKPDQPFAYSEIDDNILAETGERLAPVYVSEISLASQLTDKYTLYDVLKVREPEAGTVLSNWKTHSAQKSLAVPIGITSNDEPQTLDLHEKAHGPHGLVAGTTGSGKSEAIISYLMSLAWHYSPEDVNIAIIDFKGGGMGNQLEGLPHLTSVITNLEEGELERSLSSIKAELIMRQKMMAEAKVSNISDYIREYKAGRLEKPLPHLLLVVDEFAELKAQQPEFMDELISAARIGRSLGVHLILSTQKPHGVVNDQILSNMDFKMCLRVQTREDSNEMLESPLASEIREPGRAYMKVNRCEMFQLFQSGYSGGSIANTDVVQSTFQISELNLAGKRNILYQYAPPKEENTEDEKAVVITQFMKVMEAIKAAWKEAGIEEPRKLCLPPLPKEQVWQPEAVREPHEVPIGLIDMPALQQQVPMMVELDGGNTLIVGGNQTGKTVMLQTILRAAAETMTPEDVSFYIMDFNSGVFKTMEKLSIVGGVVTLDDEERMKNLIKLLRTEISGRKEKMLEQGVLTFSAYRESGNDDMPALVLMIDNFAVFREVYDDKYGDELLTILRDGAAVGLSVFATAGQSSALGYRRMCYFDHRVALHCPDTSEYSSVLEGCRKTIGEIPGRALIRVEKEILSAQIYLPFEGENEKERAAACAEFIREHQTGIRAKMIPEIPANLTTGVMFDMFGVKPEEGRIPLAVSYAEVEPVWVNLYEDFELALIGSSRIGNGQQTALDMFMSVLTAEPEKANIRIVDSFEKSLRAYQEAENVVYTLDARNAPGFITEIASIAEDRYDLVDQNGMEALDDLPAEILILNGQDALESASGDTEAVQEYERLSHRYRRMKIFFLFAGVENKAISYSSSDLVRHLKEMQEAIVFENANQIRVFDISLTETRANAEKLGRNDAFIVSEEHLTRIRLVSPEEQA